MNLYLFLSFAIYLLSLSLSYIYLNNILYYHDLFAYILPIATLLSFLSFSLSLSCIIPYSFEKCIILLVKERCTFSYKRHIAKINMGLENLNWKIYLCLFHASIHMLKICKYYFLAFILIITFCLFSQNENIFAGNKSRDKDIQDVCIFNFYNIIFFIQKNKFNDLNIIGRNTLRISCHI